MTSICTNCDAHHQKTYAFCPDCGYEMPRDGAMSQSEVSSAVALAANLNKAIEDFESRISEVEQDLSSLENEFDSSSRWEWAPVDEREKWSVWWSVTWRAFVVYMGVAAVAYLVAIR